MGSGRVPLLRGGPYSSCSLRRHRDLFAFVSGTREVDDFGGLALFDVRRRLGDKVDDDHIFIANYGVVGFTGSDQPDMLYLY